MSRDSDRDRDRSRERDRHKKHRKRRYSDEDEPFSNWKIGLVIGVIIVCFAVLYPSLFHPLLMGLLGRKESTPSVNQNRPPVHPGMGSRPGPPGHGRADVHPAMRMAAAQAEGHSTGGGGRGMMTWLMPLYTVGVVCFLLYTLFKSKKKKHRKRRSEYSDEEESSSVEDEDYEYEGNGKGKLGKKNLRSLQERLRQTEEAMSKILEQLETVQTEGKLNLDEAVMSKASTSKDPEQKAITEKNEQYINDLEKALKDFKVLSAEYDKVKAGRRNDDESEQDSDENEDENNYAGRLDEDHLEDVSSLSEEEEEEDDEYEREKKKRKVEEPEKDQDSEEEEDSKSKSQPLKQPEIVPNPDLPAESVIRSSTSNKNQARRRPKKIA
ncbi:hypothetical protein WR25_06265 [Diploscapter pachys]|uniref:Resistance to inhibitors of cholinesterase protein 3 N-terminal domain-containing protein n=1 Tax=Diploscapter pachys TaxID=2018661 RepID=A0A2A2LXE3_9BILA|nr:hypothetical protein WR25_06265 [Diploscapter pachys]